MSEQTCPPSILFEQNLGQENMTSIAYAIQHDATALAHVAMRFAQVERVPRYTPTTRENDAEHSFMLALVSQEVAASYFPDLDAGLVAQFATVHDLLELKTGDIATFNLTETALSSKQTAEHAAIDEVCAELPPYTAVLLRTYEEQTLPEARFVRLMDKIMPVLVDILGPGSQVMHEDYATYTVEQLDLTEDALRARFLRMFPEPWFSAVHTARSILVQKFSAVFAPQEYVQDPLF